LQFWSKCATSTIPSNERLDSFTKHIAQSYIQSQVESLKMISEAGTERTIFLNLRLMQPVADMQFVVYVVPFENDDQFVGNMELLGIFSRRSYEDVAETSLTLMSQIAQSWQVGMSKFCCTRHWGPALGLT
jgi:hypothetical protein